MTAIGNHFYSNKPYFFQVIPYDVALEIFHYLSFSEVDVAKLVSKAWHQICHDSRLLNMLFARILSYKEECFPAQVEELDARCSPIIKPVWIGCLAKESNNILLINRQTKKIIRYKHYQNFYLQKDILVRIRPLDISRFSIIFSNLNEEFVLKQTLRAVVKPVLCKNNSATQDKWVLIGNGNQICCFDLEKTKKKHLCGKEITLFSKDFNILQIKILEDFCIILANSQTSKFVLKVFSIKNKQHWYDKFFLLNSQWDFETAVFNFSIKKTFLYIHLKNNLIKKIDLQKKEIVETIDLGIIVKDSEKVRIKAQWCLLDLASNEFQVVNLELQKSYKIQTKEAPEKINFNEYWLTFSFGKTIHVHNIHTGDLIKVLNFECEIIFIEIRNSCLIIATNKNIFTFGIK